MSLEAPPLATMADVLQRQRARSASLRGGDSLGEEADAPQPVSLLPARDIHRAGGGACGCRWIEDDDHFIERIRRGEDVFCGCPVERPGDAWCAQHRARVYLRRGSAQHEAELTAELSPAEHAEYHRLRAKGLALVPAVAVIIRSRRRPAALAA
jgi:hypothetical protein